MDECEQQAMVADAIVLERAVRVLERRVGPVIPGNTSETWDAGVVAFLRYGAKILRDGAERDA